LGRLTDGASTVGSWIIASWGNPFIWRPAKYHLHGYDQDPVESRTTLPLLAKTTKAKGATIIIPDTLAIARPRRDDKECSHLDKPLTHAEKYEEIREAAERIVNEWIHNCISLDKNIEPRIVVAPTVGSYAGSREGPRLEASYHDKLQAAPAEAYWTVAVLETLRALKEEGVDKLVVDLTYGVNYMPAELYAATLYAASLYAVATGENVVLEYYNSTPYPQGYQEEIPELPVFKIETIKITPTLGALHLQTVQISREPEILAYSPDTPKDAIDKIEKITYKLRPLIEKGRQALATAIIAAPLAPLIIDPEGLLPHNCAIRLVEEALDIQNENVSVETSNNIIKIQHRVAVKKESAAQILLAGYIIKYIKRISPKSAGVSTDYCADIDSLKASVEKMVFPNRFLADHELDNIDNCINSGSGCFLSRYQDPRESSCKGRRPSSRNFYAHAGLERNVTVVVPRMRLVCYPRECKSCVEELLEEVLDMLFKG